MNDCNQAANALPMCIRSQMELVRAHFSWKGGCHGHKQLKNAALLVQGCLRSTVLKIMLKFSA